MARRCCAGAGSPVGLLALTGFGNWVQSGPGGAQCKESSSSLPLLRRSRSQAAANPNLGRKVRRVQPARLALPAPSVRLDRKAPKDRKGRSGLRALPENVAKPARPGRKDPSDLRARRARPVRKGRLDLPANAATPGRRASLVHPVRRDRPAHRAIPAPRRRSASSPVRTRSPAPTTRCWCRSCAPRARAMERGAPRRVQPLPPCACESDGGSQDLQPGSAVACDKRGRCWLIPTGPAVRWSQAKSAPARLR